LALNVLIDTDAGEGELNMRATNVLNNRVESYPDDTLGDSNLEKDETDDLEEFPLLLQSGDVRDLIEAAAKRGLSAPALTRRLVRDFLRRTRGILLVSNTSTSERRP
jgi:hypothetical protein